MIFIYKTFAYKVFLYLKQTRNGFVELHSHSFSGNVIIISHIHSGFAKYYATDKSFNYALVLESTGNGNNVTPALQHSWQHNEELFIRTILHVPISASLQVISFRSVSVNICI